MTRSLCTLMMVGIGLALSGCSRADVEAGSKAAQEEARRRADAAVIEADKRAKEWQPWLDAAKEAKAEYDKVFPSKKDYDIIFTTPEEGSERLKAHDARLAKMDRVEIDGFTVGYEERKERSLGGKSFQRHFRATWVYDRKVVGVSYYSMEAMDLVAFQELLKKLVPISNEAFRHVQLKRATPEVSTLH
jgi:hypothetical protein